MKKKLRISFALIAALVLLAAVALAVGLTYSAKYTASKTAREALMDKYHLTQEMLRMFNREETWEEDGKTVTEIYGLSGSQFLNLEAMGKYTVAIDAKGNADVSWTHDDADPASWQSGDLTSPVWGAPQLSALLDRYAAYRQWWQDNEGVYGLPVAEQAKRFEELYALTAPIKLVDAPIAPSETASAAAQSARPAVTPPPSPSQAPAPTARPGDLSAGELLLLARQAMAAEYGLSERELDAYETSVWYQYDEDGHCCVDFNGYETCGYVVLRPTDGEIQKVCLDSELGANG